MKEQNASAGKCDEDAAATEYALENSVKASNSSEDENSEPIDYDFIVKNIGAKSKQTNFLRHSEVRWAAAATPETDLLDLPCRPSPNNPRDSRYGSENRPAPHRYRTHINHAASRGRPEDTASAYVTGAPSHIEWLSNGDRESATRIIKRIRETRLRGRVALEALMNGEDTAGITCQSLIDAVRSLIAEEIASLPSPIAATAKAQQQASVSATLPARQSRFFPTPQPVQHEVLTARHGAGRRTFEPLREGVADGSCKPLQGSLRDDATFIRARGNIWPGMREITQQSLAGLHLPGSEQDPDSICPDDFMMSLTQEQLETFRPKTHSSPR